MYRSSYKSLTYVWISDTGEDAIAGRGVASWRQIYFSRICTRGNRGLSISHDAVFNPLPVRFFNLNFHPLEDASRYRDPQLQVGKNYSYLFTLRPNTNEFLLIKHIFISQKKPSIFLDKKVLKTSRVVLTAYANDTQLNPSSLQL